MANLALLDLVLPYVLRGDNLGSFHALASALRVTSYEQAGDNLGITIRGRGEFNGWAKLFPNGTFSVAAGVNEAEPVYDPANRQPVFDLAETAIEFELLVPRIRSDIVFAGEGSLGTDTASQQTRTVLDTLAGPVGSPTTDYPSTGFVLDLILDAPSLRPPFLHPAQLADTGTLVPDQSVNEVALTLPKLRFRLSHGDTNPSLLRFELVSFGATGLDDPGDLGVAELVSMSPPYAYIGGSDSTTVGIGFRSATLDLSADNTPPTLRDKAGVGDDWTGLYLPEARVFFSPNGVRNLAFEGGAHEFLLGIGHDSAGIWGDFEIAVVEQGNAKPAVSARFVDANNKAYGIEPTGATTATARLPAHTRMIVDVNGGRMPYKRTVTAAGGAAEQGTIFVIDLSNAPSGKAEIGISVTDSSPMPQTVTLTITAQLVTAPALLPSPAPSQPPRQPATMTPPAGTPTIALQSQTDTDVVLASVPPDATLMWKVDNKPETGPFASIAVPVAPGEQHTVVARKPGTAAAAQSDTIYFFFDRPPPQPDDTYPRPDSSSKAISKSVNIFEPPDVDPLVQYKDHFDAVAKTAHTSGTDVTITIEGRASYEGVDDDWHRQHNYLLAGRRAQAARDLIAAAYPEPHLKYAITPNKTAPTKAEINQWVTDTDWNDPAHVVPHDRDYWCAIVGLPAVSTPEHSSSVTISRPAAPPPPQKIEPIDPTPTEPEPPDWFRSCKLLVRVVKGDIIAAEADVQLFMQAFVNESLTPTGVNTANSPAGRSLKQGVPVGQGNPTDGITNFRLLVQSDPSTGRESILGSIGADPADTSGLMVWGWLPGEQPEPRDVVRNLIGSYMTFWPLLADLPLDAAAGQASNESVGAALVDVGLSAAAMAIPAVIGALPFLEVERVVWYGGELHVGLRHGTGDFETDILADLAIAWGTTQPIVNVLTINPNKPLTVRYKAIGVHTADRDATGKAAFQLHPVFDASRGYTIDVQGSGSLVVADPLGKILRILAARLSRTNPLTLEIDIGMSVDLGVVSVTRAGVRVYLDQPRPPELTALGVSVDIAGALAGSGFVQMAHSTDAQGHPVATIGGQLDLTLRPIQLRVAAAVEIATITASGGQTATGVYVGLDIVLPVGIPLGSSGLGLFGFRGIFGMHYDRSTQWDNPGQPSSALVWLEHADGEPNKLANKQGEKLWVPYLDHWAFGAGVLIGTMEGGFILNLDGTLLIQLPGPRVVIMMNARIISPPPDMGEVGGAGGILAVIEITPDHFLVGVLISWEIPRLISIKIPVEAMFPFGADSSKWHVYLGARRPDLGQPVEVDVLGIVKGTGYLMARGDGLPAYPSHGFTLPELTGFALGVGVGASFTWGSTDIGLYLRIGGGMDAELGFQPFTLAGIIYVTGELRLFIVSVGADAELKVVAAQHVVEHPAPQPDEVSYNLSVDGKACGHVSFLFFEVSGCVEISFTVGGTPTTPIPDLVTKVSLQSRSPALAQGTGVDRGVDALLGDARTSAGAPGLPVVPIDAIPIISMAVPAAVANNTITIGGLNTDIGSAPGAPNPASSDNNAAYCEHSGDRYQYVISSITLERIDPATGQSAGDAIDEPSGPAVWWTLAGPTDPSPVAQLALLTWAPSPATKAIEKTDRLIEDLKERYGTVCAEAAEPAEQLWTFRFEPVGFSATGWDLEGVAWPDAPGTVRSSAPPSTLHVDERWRSGDPVLDAKRGIFPGYVLAGLVACERRERGSSELLKLLQAKPPALVEHKGPRLVVGGRGPVTGVAATGAVVPESDPVHAALVHSGQLPLRISARLYEKASAAIASKELVGAAMTVPDALRTLLAGPGIGVTDLASALSPTQLAATTARPASDNFSRVPSRGRCVVFVLQAPMLDDGQPIVIGDHSRSEEVAEELEAHGVTHGALDDVVVVHTGAFATFGVLLFVPEAVLEGGHLVVRALGADGSEHQRAVVTSADSVWSNPLPPHWTEPSGPWAAGVEDLLKWAQSSKTVPVYVALDEDKNADRVEIGTSGLRGREVFGVAENREATITPRYYVGAIGETRWSEVARRDWDKTQKSSDEQVLTQLLGSASGTNAFLYPDSLYRITVNSTGKRLKPPGTQASAQQFWFRTDRIQADSVDPGKLLFASTPPVPVRLDAWLLMTIPDEAEKGYFGQENVKLVFNTQDIDRLLLRYGKKVQVRFQAASAQHPKSTLALPHPFPVDPTTVATVPSALLSPYEDALEDALSQLGDAAACIPVDGSRTRHSQVDIPIPLNSCTDYLLDIELVDANAPASATGPSIFRRHFSTGLYATFEQFAGSIISPSPTARSAPPGAFTAIAGFFGGRRPAGSELDDQLRAYGIEPLEIPQRARVVVFWEQSGSASPQPAAILIDATEPLFRSRNYPTKVTDATGPVPSERWVMASREWLLLRGTAATAGLLAANGIIVAPGGQRAVVVLKPGQRGNRLALQLVAVGFSDLPFLNPNERAVTVVDMTFSAAPWEEA